MYGCPLPEVDTRAISFEIQREALILMNDYGDLDLDNDFDIIDCLDSPLLQDLDPLIKDLIRNYLSVEERNELKEEILKHNQWLSEFSPPATTCLCCNTAMYPMGLGTSARSIQIYVCLYMIKVFEMPCFNIYYYKTIT